MACIFIVKTFITSTVAVPDSNEDSVDIYDGLDMGFSSNAGKSPILNDIILIFYYNTILAK